MDYEENPGFNNYVDEAHAPVQIFSSEFKASAILYSLEPETYRLALTEYRTGSNHEEDEALELDGPEVKRD